MNRYRDGDYDVPQERCLEFVVSTRLTSLGLLGINFYYLVSFSSGLLQAAHS